MDKSKFFEWLDMLYQNNHFKNDSQIDAYKKLKEIILPNKNNEEWKFTNFKKLDQLFEIPIKHKINKNKYDVIPNEINEVKRIIISSELDKNSMDLGPNIDILTSEKANEILDKSNYENNNDWIYYLNKAVSNDILALRIKSKTKNKLELILENNLNSNYSNIFILCEKDSILDLVEVNMEFFKNSAINITKIYLEENAMINHAFISSSKYSSNLINQININQRKNSNYKLHTAIEGLSFGRLEIAINQLDGHANTELKNLQISKEDEQLTNFSNVEFNGPYGYLKQIQKSISLDNSHSIFHGIIDVPRIAQKTNASQISRNLLLSDKATIDARPELKIIADDVKCSHGATISQLEFDELFYMQTRGLSKEEAGNLLLKSFSDEVLSTMPSIVKRWGNLYQLLCP